MNQRIETDGRSAEGWHQFTVASTDYTDKISCRVEVRVPDEKFDFVDLAIEEYVGMTYRAKRCSARLHEVAARKLYEALAAKFGPAQ